MTPAETAALSLHVDRDSPVPLHLQVSRQIEHAITSGLLTPGDRIPNELDLAEELELSRPTLRQAIAYLVDKGLLVRKRGVGTQVVMSTVRRPLELSSLHEDLARSGQQPTTRLLGVEVLACDDEVADALALAPQTPVLALRRLRLAAGEPLALMSNFLPTGLIADDGARLEHDGLYAVMRAAGVTMRVARQSVGACVADAEQAELLGEEPGAPLLTMTRIAFTDTGRAVEYGRHVYRASRYSFELTLVER
jgi:GntR family transcriptional regulator